MISSRLHKPEQMAALNERYGTLLPDVEICGQRGNISVASMLSDMKGLGRVFFDMPNGFIASAVLKTVWTLPVDTGNRSDWATRRLQRVKTEAAFASVRQLLAHDPQTGVCYPWMGDEVVARYAQLLPTDDLRVITFKRKPDQVALDAAVMGIRQGKTFFSLGLWACDVFAERALLAGLNHVLTAAGVTEHQLGLFTQVYLPRGAVQRDAAQITLAANAAARSLTAKKPTPFRLKMPVVYGVAPQPGDYRQTAVTDGTAMSGRSGSVRPPSKKDLRRLLRPPPPID